MFKQLQKLGKAFMLPISILPAAGLLLGMGGALSNPNTVAAYPILDVPVLQRIFTWRWVWPRRTRAPPGWRRRWPSW